jgi:hypothetical protein
MCILFALQLQSLKQKQKVAKKKFDQNGQTFRQRVSCQTKFRKKKLWIAKSLLYLMNQKPGPNPLNLSTFIKSETNKSKTTKIISCCFVASDTRRTDCFF